MATTIVTLFSSPLSYLSPCSSKSSRCPHRGPQALHALAPLPPVFYLRPLTRCATATLASLMFLKHAEHRPASGPSHLLFLLLGCSSSKPFEDSFPSPLRASNLSSVKYGATPHILQGGELCGFDETNSGQERGACPSSPAQVTKGYPRYRVPQTKVHPAVVLNWGKGGGFVPQRHLATSGDSFGCQVSGAPGIWWAEAGMIFHASTGQLSVPQGVIRPKVSTVTTGTPTHGMG